jgi:cytochrome c553
MRTISPRIPVLLACFAGCSPAGHQASQALRDCARLQSSPVSSLAEAIERVNALPKPVTGACFVASLPRPLDVVATTSIISAQPAASERSPRIFLLMRYLTVGIVPEGDGSHFVEMGEWASSTRSLKAEVAVPVTGALDADEPFTHIQKFGEVTACGVCHGAEEPRTAGAGSVSGALRPPPEKAVTLDALAAEHWACVESGETSERCEYYHALFDFGALRRGAFSEDVPLFQP